MGGLNSGRGPYVNEHRVFTDEVRRLTLSMVLRVFDPKHAGGTLSISWPDGFVVLLRVSKESGRVLLSLPGADERDCCPVALECTPQHWGCRRHLLCPRCGGRCEILYFVRASAHVECKRCAGLFWRSQFRVHPRREAEFQMRRALAILGVGKHGGSVKTV